MAADQPRAALALQLLQAELTPGRAPAVGRCDAAPAPAAPPLAHRACRPSRPRRGVGRPPTAACTRDGRGAHAAEHRRVQRARRMVRREPRRARGGLQGGVALRGRPRCDQRHQRARRARGSRAQPEHERPSVPIVDVRRLRESALAAQELRHAAARARELPRAAAARAALRRRPLPHHPLGVRAQRARVCRGLPQQPAGAATPAVAPAARGCF
mmetsp:Transcript_459/g.927  ORF Transcript_459/g.927 Transcript_459/m.927 type:complete len:214 (-) Transcript_459:123-764(-)